MSIRERDDCQSIVVAEQVGIENEDVCAVFASALWRVFLTVM